MPTTTHSELAARFLQSAEMETSVTRSLRADLAAYANGQSTQALLKTVQDIADSEEQARIFSQAGRVPEDSFDAWMIQTALLSTDDTWSGRGNDLRRVVADARRKTLDRINIARSY